MDSEQIKRLIYANDLKVNLTNFGFLPQVKHREKIAKTCKGFHKINNAHTFGGCIILNNGDRAILPNHPEVHVPYFAYGFNPVDSYWDKQTLPADTHYDFPALKPQSKIQKVIHTFVEECLQLYHTFRVIRRTDELTLIMSCSYDHPITHHQDIYQNTIDDFEQFACHYFDDLIDLFIEQLPALALTRFATEPRYRARVIKNRAVLSPLKLYPREQACLFWASKGKSAAETAIILGCTERTIETYRKTAIKKLNASNITHAVALALSQGLIT